MGRIDIIFIYDMILAKEGKKMKELPLRDQKGRFISNKSLFIAPTNYYQESGMQINLGMCEELTIKTPNVEVTLDRDQMDKLLKKLKELL